MFSTHFHIRPFLKNSGLLVIEKARTWSLSLTNTCSPDRQGYRDRAICCTTFTFLLGGERKVRALTSSLGNPT